MLIIQIYNRIESRYVFRDPYGTHVNKKPTVVKACDDVLVEVIYYL